MKTSTALLLSALALSSDFADAHGRMISPPHRGYIGKLPQFKDLVPINYSDNGLSAGGIGGTKGGKHGVCGDPYTGTRHHETGGTYGTFPVHGSKVVGACYAPGSTVDLQIQLTANHKGYFQFGLCKLNGKNDKETEECFQTLAQPSGEKQWPVPTGNEVFSMKYTLPSGVSCQGDSHCVLRWHYVGWNNPGVDINGQEQFWNCADIYISNTCGANPSPSTGTPTQAPKPTQAPSTKAPSPTSPTYTTQAPKTTTPTSPTQAPGQCGACANCYYAPTNSCFVGWSAAQCAAVPLYKWCGPSPAVQYLQEAAPALVALHGQCGGRHYTGATQCQADAQCVAIDEYFSECVAKTAL